MPARPAKLMPKTKLQARQAVQAYLASVPVAVRRTLNHLRKAITAAAPGAEDDISYGLPAFRLDGRLLVCYRAAKAHCSFHPMSAAVIRAHTAQLKSYSTSMGTIRFGPDKSLPLSLVRKLVKTRIAELRNRQRSTAHNPR